MQRTQWTAQTDLRQPGHPSLLQVHEGGKGRPGWNRLRPVLCQVHGAKGLWEPGHAVHLQRHQQTGPSTKISVGAPKSVAGSGSGSRLGVLRLWGDSQQSSWESRQKSVDWLSVCFVLSRNGSCNYANCTLDSLAIYTCLYIQTSSLDAPPTAAVSGGLGLGFSMGASLLCCK